MQLPAPFGSKWFAEDSVNKDEVEVAPKLTAAELAALNEFWLVYDKHFDEVAAQMQKDVAQHPELADVFAHADAVERRRNHELIRRAIVDGDWRPYLSATRAIGVRCADRGLTFSSWFESGRALRVRLIPLLVQAYAKSPERVAQGVRGNAIFIDLAMVTLGEAYLARKEAIVRAQQAAIQELSTPVLELRSKLLLLPMIGLIDSDRARLMTEQLLLGIASKRARVVIVDVTGVPAVDSAVANHLIQTVRAVRLMGANALVSGLSTENAQTLARLGIELGNLDTVGSLSDAVDLATRTLENQHRYASV
jgi:anti-anti-sigma regulatory factor